MKVTPIKKTTVNMLIMIPSIIAGAISARHFIKPNVQNISDENKSAV